MIPSLSDVWVYFLQSCNQNCGVDVEAACKLWGASCLLDVHNVCSCLL
jgi:hypothetical protein